MKVILICQYGASTSMFASKMKEAAKKMNLEFECTAMPASNFEESKKEADVYLLGPQVSYKKDEYLKRYSELNNKLYVIESIDFGMMNGEKVLKEILEVNK